MNMTLQIACRFVQDRIFSLHVKLCAKWTIYAEVGAVSSFMEKTGFTKTY